MNRLVATSASSIGTDDRLHWIQNGLVGWWKFADHDASDRSTNENAVTWAGSPSFSAGGMPLNGTSQYGSLGTTSDLNLTSAWSIFISFKLASDALTNSRLWSRFAGGTGLSIYWVTANRILVADGTDITVGGTQATANVNHTAVVVETGGKGNIYIDGILSGSANQTLVAVSKASTQTNIGADSAGINFFKGTLYEVMAFNKALSAIEIASLHALTGI